MALVCAAAHHPPNDVRASVSTSFIPSGNVLLQIMVTPEVISRDGRKSMDKSEGAAGIIAA